MGAATAIALAETVTDHDSLVRAITIHLTSNCYPAFPVSYVAPCVEAIEAINKDTYKAGDIVTLPDNVQPLPRLAEFDGKHYVVGIPTLIDIFHLYHFITQED